MNFNEKVINFSTAITNVYRSEENQDYVQTIGLDDKNITEDFTALLYAFALFFRQVTGEEPDIIDFTHILNKLAVQHLIDDHPTEKGGAE